MANKWSRTYWADLGERVASTAVYGGITLLTANAVTDLTAALAWTIVGLPTVLSLLKGLLANLKDAESGPSLLPSPPAPDVTPDDRGITTLGLVLVVLLVVVVLALLGAL